MICLGNEPRSFCHFWDCTQVWHFRLLLTGKATPSLLRDSCPCIHGNLLQSCLTLCDTMDCSSPGISVRGSLQTRISFHFDSASSFFIELFLHSFPVAYWTSTNLGGSSFSVTYFCLFILFMGFSRQQCWSGSPLPSLVDHILSELYSMIRPSWVALHGIVHCFIELHKAMIHVMILISFQWLCFHSVYPLMDEDKSLLQASWCEGQAME